jgi:dihydroflavonol-4-reductase
MSIVLVTGATGHIGAHVVRGLLAQGRSVRCLVRDDTRALAGLPVEKVRGDVRDLPSLVRAAAGAEVVYHLAGRISIDGDPDGSVWATNAAGTANLVDACLGAGVRRLVHFASVHAFRRRPFGEALDEWRPLVGPGDRQPAYDRSKAQGVRHVLAGVRRGLDAVIVCPTGVLGPLDVKPSFMGQFLLNLCRGRLPALSAGGFDWVDVRDVATTALAAERLGRTGQTYLLSGRWAPLRGLAEILADAEGVPVPRLTTPLWLAGIGAPFLRAWAALRKVPPLYTRESLSTLRAGRVCGDKAARELGHAPRPVRETLRDSVRWFRDTGSLGRSDRPALLGAPGAVTGGVS